MFNLHSDHSHQFMGVHMPASQRKFRLLVASTGPRDTSWAQALVVRLSKHPLIEIRAIVDDVVPRLLQTIIVMQNIPLAPIQGERPVDVDFYRQQAAELVEWSDLMVCVPLDADGISKMLAGICDTFLGEVLRSWDNQKNIIMVPGMSTQVWSGSTTKHQLSMLHRSWSWIRVMSPILWHYEGEVRPRRVPCWSGFNDVLRLIQNQAELSALGRNPEVAGRRAAVSTRDLSFRWNLPPEIWSNIFELLGDWEMATALGVWTNLPMPSPWISKAKDPNDPLQVYEHDLEWTFLKGSQPAICKKLSQAPLNFRDLSSLMVKLTIRFVLTDVLAYLEANRPDLLEAFGGGLLPKTASACFPRIPLLNYWKQSKWFTAKGQYDEKAIDGASENGHVHVLDWWWRESGVPLCYTEAALEQASANGYLDVLDWWRAAAAQDEKIVLRPGRSLLLAMQHGQMNVIEWWASSALSIGYEAELVKLASRSGRVEILETWRRARGVDSLIYNEDVLISPTVKQHVHVLEWWRQLAHGELPGMDGQGKPVRFKTYSIEAAIEICDGDDDEQEIKDWWERHGLVSGLCNEERMKTRHL
ncbi:hypothetical protein HJFPF1_09101 [Paramyrothecium foliicola]|nr:hypothetical protein HJFPF1_09101 [Paramyrothecium foliicola]